MPSYNYALVIPAAMAGEGISMGRSHVTDSLIQKRLPEVLRIGRLRKSLSLLAGIVKMSC